MDQRLTRAQLASTAEQRFRKTFPNLRKHERRTITERTIRYWTREGLLPPRGHPNQLGLYEPEFVDRCVFIRRLKLEEALTINHIRQVLSSVDDETIRRVAEGVEPLRVKQSRPGNEPQRRGHERVIVLPVEDDDVIRNEVVTSSSLDDRPVRLQSLSDLDKAAAIASAIQSLGLESDEYSVDIEAVDYSRFVPRTPFRSPARIDYSVFADPDSEADFSALDELRGIADDQLCSAIATELSHRCGEPYQSEFLSKKYLQSRDVSGQNRRQLRFSILIAKQLN